MRAFKLLNLYSANEMGDDKERRIANNFKCDAPGLFLAFAWTASGK
jgi:hypothetical protein